MKFFKNYSVLTGRPPKWSDPVEAYSPEHAVLVQNKRDNPEATILWPVEIVKDLDTNLIYEVETE